MPSAAARVPALCVSGVGEEWCSRNFYSYHEAVQGYSASSHGQDYWTGDTLRPALGREGPGSGRCRPSRPCPVPRALSSRCVGRLGPSDPRGPDVTASARPAPPTSASRLFHFTFHSDLIARQRARIYFLNVSRASALGSGVRASSPSSPRCPKARRASGAWSVSAGGVSVAFRRCVAAAGQPAPCLSLLIGTWGRSR